MDKRKLVNWINKLIREDNIHAFYISKSWIELRSKVLKEQNNECQICKERGKYKRARTVHHIKHIKNRPDLALTRSNLLCVCEACHNELHPEKFEKYIFKTKKSELNEERW